MIFQISSSIERWPVAGSFIIARGAKTHVDVVTCTVARDGFSGLGEGTAIYYHGESAESALAQLQDFAARHPDCDRAQVNAQLPPGCARNALDCALWDWERQAAGTSLSALAGLPAPAPLRTAFTISLSDPVTMETDARRAAAAHPLLKLKLAGDGRDFDRVVAVHRGAPAARLIVDANESWDGQDVAAHAAALAPYGVELIEQPVPAGKDAQLAGVNSPVPLCADESCHIAADVARLRGLYAAVNIKLDKAGGLTEAIALADTAQAAGMQLMVGCMLATSLGIAPAFALAQRARWVDLDGPLLLAKDRANGFRFADGMLIAPEDSPQS